MTFDFESVKKLIACPKTKTELVLDADRLVNTDPATRLCYPIVDEIPLLLPNASAVLPREEWSEIMVRQQRDPQTGALL